MFQRMVIAIINAIKFSDGSLVGAFTFPDRKKPYIAVKNDNRIECFGQFSSEEAATEFMDMLCEKLGIKKEGSGNE